MKKFSILLSFIFIFIMSFGLPACKPPEEEVSCDVAGHLFNEYVYNSDASCLQNGTETSVCARKGCSETDTREREGSKVGHKLEVVNYKANTCTTDGTKAHYKCTKCEAIFNESFEEIEDKSSIIIPASHVMNESIWYREEGGHCHKCEKCETYSEISAHESEIGAFATEDHGVYCKHCGWEMESPLPHTHLLEFVQETQSSCSVHGLKSHYKCTKCGSLFSDDKAENKVYQYELEKEFTHEWEEEKSVVLEAVRGKQGIKGNKCKHCDEYINGEYYLWDDDDYTILV